MAVLGVQIPPSGVTEGESPSSDGGDVLVVPFRGVFGVDPSVDGCFVVDPSFDGDGVVPVPFCVVWVMTDWVRVLKPTAPVRRGLAEAALGAATGSEF